jgi:hypothetical protein
MPKILPQPNEFADELLDVVGQEFKFDHAKGLAEWIKNCADAYICDEVPDDEQVMLIDLHETSPKRDSTFRVTDFVGMTHAEIMGAFKRWGDPRAAKRGTRKQTLGGHGNGGPATNVDYWNAKLNRNMERDVEQTQRLEAAGWTVLRFWGHEIDREPDGCAQRVRLAYAGRA